jgi:hypothetical protein
VWNNNFNEVQSPQVKKIEGIFLCISSLESVNTDMLGEVCPAVKKVQNVFTLPILNRKPDG